MLSKGDLAKLRARRREYLVYDSQFLFLRVYPSGRKAWIFRRRIDGKDRQTTLGEYPDMSISDARVARDNAIQADKARRTAGMQFGDLFDLWTKERRIEKVVLKTLKTERHCFNLLTKLHRRGVRAISRSEIVSILRDVAGISLDTAYKSARMVKQIFDFAVDIGELDEPHCAVHLARGLPQRKATNYAAVHDLQEIGKLLRALDHATGYRSKIALKIIAYTFVRHGELRQARWRDIDFENAIWTIPAENTKKRRDLLVPMARQVIELFGMLNRENSDELIFGIKNQLLLFRSLKRLQRLPPEIRSKPTTVHGFRSMASTILNEHEWPSDAIERQLAHVSSGVRAVYNKAQYFDTRRRMMQWYADYLDALRDGKPEPEKP